MEIITIVGSTKFKDEYEAVKIQETLKGNIVLDTGGVFGHHIGMDMSGEVKKMLDRLHFKKIDISHSIYVVNPNGYIGLSTCDEIHYAMSQDKKIYWLIEPKPDCGVITLIQNKNDGVVMDMEKEARKEEIRDLKERVTALENVVTDLRASLRERNITIQSTRCQRS